MILITVLQALILTLGVSTAQDLPTLYEYYTSGGIQTGLDASKPYFTLNGRNISIYSGSVHYFRIPRVHWRSELRKARSAGLNAVETYIPWNLHEYYNLTYDFGNGGTDMEDFLHVEEFLQIAKEEDLFVIVRPGPYICSEWDWGGLPAWLLRYPDLKLRTSESTYMFYVSRYFNVLLPILAKYQFTKNGSVIAFQVENEYAYYGSDKDYLQQLYQLMISNGIVELLLTSDWPTSGFKGSLEGTFLQAANFGNNPKAYLDALKGFIGDRPPMILEYWTGGSDHIGVPFSRLHYESDYEIVLNYPASINLYMFRGGTNWGFLNGNGMDNKAPFYPTQSPIGPSYHDYGAITEGGNFTENFDAVARLIEKYNPIKTKLPTRPDPTPKVQYPSVLISDFINITTIIELVEDYVYSSKASPMELLPINNLSGQSFGYINYRKVLDIPQNATLKIGGYITDTLMVFVNGQLINNKPLKSMDDLNDFGYFMTPDSTLSLPATQNATLDLVVENWGRAHFGFYVRLHKGLQENVYLNNNPLEDWIIYPLEFKKQWNLNLKQYWSPRVNNSGTGLYRATFNLTEDPQDTYIDVRNWNKGFVIINGFVLSKYSALLPHQTLYLPKSLLQKGANEIIFFEHFQPSENIVFSAQPIIP